MMRIVKGSNPEEKLGEVQTSRAALEARREALKGERQAKLLEPDFALQDVHRINDELKTIDASFLALDQREAALKELQSAQIRARRVNEKRAAVAKVEEDRRQVLALAREVDEL